MVKQFIKLLKKEIQEHGQPEVVERSGLSRQSIYMLVSGKATPTVETIEKVSKKLGYEVKVVFNDLATV